MHVDHNDVETKIDHYRHAKGRLFETRPENQALTTFQDPGPGASVLAEDFLAHLDLAAAPIHRVLKRAYAYLDRNPGLRDEVHARVRFAAWMTLRGHKQLAPAMREIAQDPHAAQRLGFTAIPAYDTMREFLNDRLGEEGSARLIRALRVKEARLLPDLGRQQVEDATPLPARRRDEEAPYNGHYKTPMRKLELRWDARHEALLAHAYCEGTSDEEPYATVLTKALESDGIHAHDLFVDNAYTSFQTHAAHWRVGTMLHHRSQDDWRVDAAKARADVAKRIQKHWDHPQYPVDGDWDQRVRFLHDHGSTADRDAIGRWARDAMLAAQTRQDEATLRLMRSRNEAHNGTIKTLPLEPARCGARNQYQRVLACVLTLHMVQLTRIQNGVHTCLLRTTHIV